MSQWYRPNVFRKRWGSYGSIKKPQFKQYYNTNQEEQINRYEEFQPIEENYEMGGFDPFSKPKSWWNNPINEDPLDNPETFSNIPNFNDDYVDSEDMEAEVIEEPSEEEREIDENYIRNKPMPYTEMQEAEIENEYEDINEIDEDYIKNKPQEYTEMQEAEIDSEEEKIKESKENFQKQKNLLQQFAKGFKKTEEEVQEIMERDMIQEPEETKESIENYLEERRKRRDLEEQLEREENTPEAIKERNEEKLKKLEETLKRFERAYDNSFGNTQGNQNTINPNEIQSRNEREDYMSDIRNTYEPLEIDETDLRNFENERIEQENLAEQRHRAEQDEAIRIKDELERRRKMNERMSQNVQEAPKPLTRASRHVNEDLELFEDGKLIKRKEEKKEKKKNSKAPEEEKPKKKFKNIFDTKDFKKKDDSDSDDNDNNDNSSKQKISTIPGKDRKDFINNETSDNDDDPDSIHIKLKDKKKPEEITVTPYDNNNKPDSSASKIIPGIKKIKPSNLEKPINVKPYDDKKDFNQGVPLKTPKSKIKRMEMSDKSREKLKMRKQKLDFKNVLNFPDERKRIKGDEDIERVKPALEEPLKPQPNKKIIVPPAPPPVNNDIENEPDFNEMHSEDQRIAEDMWKEHWEELDSIDKIYEQQEKAQQEKLEKLRNNLEKTKQILQKHKYKEPTKLRLARLNEIKAEKIQSDKEKKIMNENEEIRKDVEKETKEIEEEDEYVWEMEIMKKMERGTKSLYFTAKSKEQLEREKNTLMKRNIINYLKKMEDVLPTYKQQIEIATCKEFLENPDKWEKKHEYEIEYNKDDEEKEKKPTLKLTTGRTGRREEQQPGDIPGIRPGWANSYGNINRNINWSEPANPEEIDKEDDEIIDSGGMVFGADERKNRHKKKPNYNDVDIVYSTVGPQQQKEKTKK